MSLMAFLVGSFMTEDFRLTTSETHKWPLLHQVLDDRQLDCMPTQKHGNLSCIQYWMTEGLSPCHMVTFLAWSTGWQKVWVHAKAKSLVANVTYTQKRMTQARMQARRPFLRRVLEVRGLDRHAHSTTPRTLDRAGVSSFWVLRMLRMLQGGASIWCRRMVSAAARFCLAMAIPRGVKPFWKKQEFPIVEYSHCR